MSGRFSGALSGRSGKSLVWEDVRVEICPRKTTRRKLCEEEVRVWVVVESHESGDRPSRHAK